MHCHLRVSFPGLVPGVALLLGLLAPSLVQAQPAPPARAVKVLRARGSVARRREVGSSEDAADWNVASAAQGENVVASQPPPAVSLWASLGYGLGDPIGSTFVNAIAPDGGGDVYAGGYFTVACFNPMCTNDSYVNHVAKWNPDGWSGLANGVSFAAFALAVDGNDLYVGGGFYGVCENIQCFGEQTPVYYVARWNGSTWSPVGHGLNDIVWALAVSGSDLYAGGSFTEICGNETCDSGNTPAMHVAKWNGSEWSALGDGLDDAVHALAISGSDLYVGGDFGRICGDAACSERGTPANHIAKWNGSSWSTLGNGTSKQTGRSAVNALAVIGTDVYVGGGFKELCGNDACDSGNTTANYIAKWDGHGWSTLRDGVDSDVNALAISGSDLYVGGNFGVVCGSSACDSLILNTPVFGIARWDGSFWWDLRYGVDSVVSALAVDENALYVGGAFTHICATGGCTPGATVNYIASYSLPTMPPTPTGTLADTATLTPTLTTTPPPLLTATHTAAGSATDTVPAPSTTPTGGAVLVGDCSGRGSVSISDLITLVNIALGSQPASACPDGIPAGTTVDIALLIQAVNNALHS
jgi:hypothetical protein